jgi:hypothetical protein
MSDVTVAPPGAAPSAAPSTSEVPINQNPASSPNPIGSQAPPAPTGDIKGSEHRTPSTREALQKAFDRANNPPPKGERPAPKPALRPAEAKAGHNNPPEPTEKFDLKKRPSEQSGQVTDQPRDRGRFAPRQAESAANAGQVRPGNVQNTPKPGGYTQLPPHAPFATPPVRMSERARHDWAATPETVRGDIHRLQGEFAKAYQFYKGDYEAYKPIKHFAKLAQDNGTDLKTALTNFIGIEEKLRKDPIAGLDQIVYNLNLIDPQTNRRLDLRDVAYTVLSQSPEQLKSTQMGNAQTAAQHQIGALHQEVAGLKNTLQQLHTQAQFTYTRSAVDQFAVSHPRLDELGDLIEQELKLGFDLDTAYRRAELLRPATHAAQTRTTPAQTRTIDRSIHGAPDVAPNGASRRPQKPSGSPRDAVQNALNRVNGRV